MKLNKPITIQDKENKPQNTRLLKQPYQSQAIKIKKELSIQYFTLDHLPFNLLYNLMAFFTTYEILTMFKPLNKQFFENLKKTHFWVWLNKVNPINLIERYVRYQCLVERRSKGKLYFSKDLLTHQRYTQRIVDVILANANHNDGIQTSILRELSYLQTLKPHKNINKIIKAEQVKTSKIVILYEWQPFSLKDLIRKTRNQINKSLDTDLIRQIVNGMEYLHSYNILHRNLKPENILVTEDMTIKICDLNLSRWTQGPIFPYTPEDPKDRERSGRESRRLWYRSPELLLRKQYYSKCVDVWAFGCIFAEMVLGECLFTGDTEISQLFQIFQLLGSPSKNDIKNLCDEGEERALMFPQWQQYPLDIVKIPKDQFKTYENTMRNTRAKAFKNIQFLNSVLNSQGLDLLQQCLCLNPNERIKFSEIKQHPFFGNKTPQEESKQSLLSTIPPCPQLKNYFQDNFQVNLTPQMRSVLLDWLIDVSTNFDLRQNTLHLAVIYLDLILSKLQIQKNNLQLLGVTCLKIADVYYEKSREYYKQENCAQLAYITAGEYNQEQLIEMEKIILKELDFQVTYVTSIDIIEIFRQDFTPKQLSFAQFFADFFLQTQEVLKYDILTLTAGYVFLSITVDDNQNFEKQQLKSKQNIVIKKTDFIKCVNDLKLVWFKWKSNPEQNQLDAVHQRHKNLNTRSINIQFKQNDLENFFDQLIQI